MPKDAVLAIWQRIPDFRKNDVVAIVDLDTWIYFGIPGQYHSENIIYTQGYSIENDIFIDANLLAMCDAAERKRFEEECSVVLAWHARQIALAAADLAHILKVHPNQILDWGDISNTLTPVEKYNFSFLEKHYIQALRGKTLLQLLVRQLSRPGRYAKFGYKQIYEIASANLGVNLLRIENDIRSYICR